MNDISILFIILLLLMIIGYIIWRRTDFAKHPEEYRTKGATGERLAYLQLIKRYKIPEDQVFRNVYIPTKSGTAEIDLIVVSKKGLFVFECKNYSGVVYGDGGRRKWVQYLGKKKSYFLNPLFQNKYHAKCLRQYFAQIQDLPVFPFVVVTDQASWHIRNLGVEDYILGNQAGVLGEFYERLPDSQAIAKYFRTICGELRNCERPNEVVRREHIKQVRGRR